MEAQIVQTVCSAHLKAPSEPSNAIVLYTPPPVAKALCFAWHNRPAHTKSRRPEAKPVKVEFTISYRSRGNTTETRFIELIARPIKTFADTANKGFIRMLLKTQLSKSLIDQGNGAS